MDEKVLGSLVHTKDPMHSGQLDTPGQDQTDPVVLRPRAFVYNSLTKRLYLLSYHGEIIEDRSVTAHPLTSSSRLRSGSSARPFPLVISSRDFFRAAFSCLYFSRSLSSLELPDFKPHLPIMTPLAVLEFIFQRLRRQTRRKAFSPSRTGPLPQL